jgi:hypothetical protein
MKIHTVGAELFLVDRWTDMVKLTVAYLIIIVMISGTLLSMNCLVYGLA